MVCMVVLRSMSALAYHAHSQPLTHLQHRREVRARREYLFRKAVEEKSRTTQQRKQRLKAALEGEAAAAAPARNRTSCPNRTSAPRSAGCPTVLRPAPGHCSGIAAAVREGSTLTCWRHVLVLFEQFLQLRPSSLASAVPSHPAARSISLPSVCPPL